MEIEHIPKKLVAVTEKVKILNLRKMKTKILKYVFVVAIAMVSGINVFNAQKSVQLSDIALANVEALADDEVVVDFPCVIQEKATCSFIGRLADGSTGNVDVEGARNI